MLNYMQASYVNSTLANTLPMNELTHQSSPSHIRPSLRGAHLGLRCLNALRGEVASIHGEKVVRHHGQHGETPKGVRKVVQLRVVDHIWTHSHAISAQCLPLQSKVSTHREVRRRG